MTTIANAVIGAAERAVAAVAVARTVAVVSYNADQQTVRVREVVGEDPIEIDGVPIQWPGGGGRSITWGLEAGDLGTLLVRDVSHDEVDAGSALPVNPASSRRWNIADGVFCPGFVVPGSLASSAYRSDGQMVIALPVGEVLRIGDSTAAKALAIAEDVRDRLVRLESLFTAHTHPVAGAVASAQTPPPYTGVGVYTPGPVTTTADLASGRVMVDT